MTGKGAFSPAARAAILDAHLGRCVSCGRPAAELHHRAPRGAGGTSNAAIGQPWNGLATCSFHHAWIESHRAHARLLGWLTTHPDPAVPYWTRIYGWCSWVLLNDDGPPCWAVRPFQPAPGPDAHAAVRAFLRQETT